MHVCVAVHIGGSTLFHWASVNGSETAAQMVTKICRSRETVARWRTTRVLIVDEVSMLDGQLFDKVSEADAARGIAACAGSARHASHTDARVHTSWQLEQVARTIRKDNRPFGET